MNASLKIIFTMIVWGSIGLFVKNINLPSTEIAFFRAAIAASIFLLYNIVVKRANLKQYSKKSLTFLLISGAAIGLNWVLLFQAYKFTTVSNATLCYYFAPVFVIIASSILYKQRLKFTQLFAIAGSIIGLMLLINGDNTAANINISYDHVKGMSYALAASSLYASVMLLNNYIKEIPGFERTLVQLSVSALVLLPFVIYRNLIHIGGYQNLILILILGVVHTAIPYFLFFSALKEIDVQKSALLSYLDPISAIIFSAIFLNESLGIPQIIGGILILFSTYINDASKSKKSTCVNMKHN